MKYNVTSRFYQAMKRKQKYDIYVVFVDNNNNQFRQLSRLLVCSMIFIVQGNEILFLILKKSTHTLRRMSVNFRRYSSRVPHRIISVFYLYISQSYYKQKVQVEKCTSYQNQHVCKILLLLLVMLSTTLFEIYCQVESNFGIAVAATKRW